MVSYCFEWRICVPTYCQLLRVAEDGLGVARLEAQTPTESVGFWDWFASLTFSSSYVDYLGKYFSMGDYLLGNEIEPFRLAHWSRWSETAVSVRRQEFRRAVVCTLEDGSPGHPAQSLQTLAGFP